MVSFAGAAPVPAEACCPAATATRAAMPNDTRNGAEIRGRFIAQPPRMTAPSRSRRSRGLAACLRFGQTPAGTRTENVKTRRELTRNVLLLTDRYSRTARGRPAHPRLPHGRANRCCNAPLLVTPQYGQADRLCATRDSPVAADPARHQPAHPLVLPRHSSLLSDCRESRRSDPTCPSSTDQGCSGPSRSRTTAAGCDPRARDRPCRHAARPSEPQPAVRAACSWVDAQSCASTSQLPEPSSRSVSPLELGASMPFRASLLLLSSRGCYPQRADVIDPVRRGRTVGAAGQAGR